MKDNDIPAFPRTIKEFATHVDDWPPERYTHYSGMTLRQWYAGLAMQGMLAGEGLSDYTHETIAKDSFAYADAMLKKAEEPRQ